MMCIETYKAELKYSDIKNYERIHCSCIKGEDECIYWRKIINNILDKDEKLPFGIDKLFVITPYLNADTFNRLVDYYYFTSTRDLILFLTAFFKHPPKENETTNKAFDHVSEFILEMLVAPQSDEAIFDSLRLIEAIFQHKEIVSEIGTPFIMNVITSYGKILLEQNLISEVFCILIIIENILKSVTFEEQLLALSEQEILEFSELFEEFLMECASNSKTVILSFKVALESLKFSQFVDQFVTVDWIILGWGIACHLSSSACSRAPMLFILIASEIDSETVYSIIFDESGFTFNFELADKITLSFLADCISTILQSEGCPIQAAQSYLIDGLLECFDTLPFKARASAAVAISAAVLINHNSFDNKHEYTLETLREVAEGLGYDDIEYHDESELNELDSKLLIIARAIESIEDKL